ncbi:MAG TPA: PilT/PilU family type 4a pilus ATPase [Acidimicrobiales bacterium]
MTAVTPDTRSGWTTRLAQALVESGYETDAHLKPLVNEALATDQTLAYLLISRNLALPSVVVGTLSQLSQVPAVDLAAFAPQPEAAAALPGALAREFVAMGLQFDGNVLVVAFAEPPTPQEVESLAGRVGHRVHAVLADPVLIARHLGSPSDHDAPGPTDGAEGPSAEMQKGPAASVDDLLTTGLAAGGQDDTVPLHIDDLLRYAVSVGASDLHLTVAMPGTIRLHGAMLPIEGCPPLSNDTIRDMIFGILPASQRERFEAEHELDTSHTIPGVGRFRVNVALQRGTVTAALRPIPHEMPVFSSLGLPDSIRSFTDLRRGLVLVTGPTGSGKSTTLASLIDIINRTKPMHIVTVEDPIEFLHDHKRSIITQREIGEDTNSFSEALRRVLRQDPDVILVGELRDLETISMALTAAETGHLVFGTLHTQDAPQTIDRVIDVFPTQQQEQIRVMLAATLEGVVTQQLVPTADGNGRAPCAEVLVCTSAVRNLIRQSKTHQIYSLMQVGGSFGMQTMDQGLANMVKEGIISEPIAYDRSSNEEDLRNHLHA